MKKLIFAILALTFSIATNAHYIKPDSDCPSNGHIQIDGTSFDYSSHGGTYKVHLFITKNDNANGILRWDTTIVLTSQNFHLTAPYYNVNNGDSVFYVETQNNVPIWQNYDGSTGKFYFILNPSNYDKYSFGIIKNIACTVTPITGLETFAEKTDAQGNLLFTWTSYTETNNKQFELEMSENGIDFTRIATINSKAPGGNSDSQINYSCLVFPETVTVLASIGGGLMGLIMIAMVIPMLFSKKYRNTICRPMSMALIAIFTMGIGFASCTKKIDNTVKVSHGTRYFRLKQLDIDGHYAYSAILTRTV